MPPRFCFRGWFVNPRSLQPREWAGGIRRPFGPPQGAMNSEQDRQERVAFLDFDDMVVTVRLWGWPPEVAFVMAAQLRSNGISASQARWMFYDALRRVQ